MRRANESGRVQRAAHAEFWARVRTERLRRRQLQLEQERKLERELAEELKRKMLVTEEGRGKMERGLDSDGRMAV